MTHLTCDQTLLRHIRKNLDAFVVRRHAREGARQSAVAVTVPAWLGLIKAVLAAPAAAVLLAVALGASPATATSAVDRSTPALSLSTTVTWTGVGARAW